MLKLNRGARFIELPEAFMQSLQQDEKGFCKLAAILKKNTGINLELNDKNLFLMAGRLNKVLREYRLSSYLEFIHLINSGDPQYASALANALTTHTTDFFREDEHFIILKKLVTDLTNHKNFNGEIRIWCAAASTGQEAYTIAMCIEEIRTSLRPFELKILATDIDHQVLDVASQGVYTHVEMAPVPAMLKQKYFKKCFQQKNEVFQVNARIRNAIHFAPFNLVSDDYLFQHAFDIVFCRNVLIYFDSETRTQIISKFAGILQPEGLLFLGHAEAGVVKASALKPIHVAIFKRAA
ncbi:MAG: protein-glutamate O-methyltransferase CheR [Bdellovibrionaceae bacterium]|nr:protein-glutamate O-methyltransferase CheR [Bdellovibrio sp.]